MTVPTKEWETVVEGSDQIDEAELLMVTPETSFIEEVNANEIFLKKVQESHETLQGLEILVSELEKKQNMFLKEELPEYRLKKELQTLRDQIKLLASRLCQELKSIESIEEEDDGHCLAVNVQTQKSQHAVLCEEILELLRHFDTVQDEYRDRNVEIVQWQLKISGKNARVEDLDEMLESGEILTKIKAGRQALDEMECRHDEILKLEQSRKDLHEMFGGLEEKRESKTRHLLPDGVCDVMDSVKFKISHSRLSEFKHDFEDAIHHLMPHKVVVHRRKIWLLSCLFFLLLTLGVILGVTFS